MTARTGRQLYKQFCVVIDRCLFSYIWRRKSSCLAKEPSHFFFKLSMKSSWPLYQESSLCGINLNCVNFRFKAFIQMQMICFRLRTNHRHTLSGSIRFNTIASDSLYYNCLIHVILSSHTIIWNSGNVTIHQHAGDRQIRHNLNKKQGQFFLYYLVPWVNIRCKENASHCYAIWSKKLTWIKNYLKTLSSIGNDSFTILGNDGNRDGNCKLSHQTITTRKTKTTT